MQLAIFGFSAFYFSHLLGAVRFRNRPRLRPRRLLRQSSAWVLGAFITRQGTDNRIQIAIAEHFRRGIRLAVRGHVLDELIDDLKTDLLVRFLAPSESELNPHL